MLFHFGYMYIRANHNMQINALVHTFNGKVTTENVAHYFLFCYYTW
jgi:hypothetical protein